MDIIFLGNLEATAIIGIYDWERETKPDYCTRY